MRRLKNAIYEIIEDDIKESLLHSLFEGLIVTLIIANVIAIVCESVIGSNEFFELFEVISIAIFTIEYLLRVWTAELKYPSKSRLKAILKFVFSPMGIIDLLSILPFYIYISRASAITADGRIIRILRLLRLLRLFKLNRYLESIKLVKKVILKRKHELVVTAFIAFLLLMISSILMYEIERVAQPDKFPNIFSAFWWAIATLTTIGYGDVYPVTDAGRILSAIISLIGIGFIALPTGIVSSGFIEEFRNGSNTDKHDDEKYQYCPHCGKKLGND